MCQRHYRPSFRMITAERCVTILEQFVSTQLMLKDRPGTNWFMQGGDRPHRTDIVFRFLHEYFGNRVIELEYPQFTDKGITWPSYSPDLSPCNFFSMERIERHCLSKQSRYSR